MGCSHIGYYKIITLSALWDRCCTSQPSLVSHFLTSSCLLLSDTDFQHKRPIKVCFPSPESSLNCNVSFFFPLRSVILSVAQREACAYVSDCSHISKYNPPCVNGRYRNSRSLPVKHSRCHNNKQRMTRVYSPAEACYSLPALHI